MIKQEIKDHINSEMLRAPLLRDAPIASLLFLTGRASVLGMFPFGVAFFAACFDKSIAYIGITALTLSLMLSAGRYMIVKYLVAALLYWVYTRVRRTENDVRDAAVCGASMVLGSLVYLLYSFTGVYDFLILLIEGILAGLMFIIFKKARSFIQNRRSRERAGQDEIISIAVSAGVLITGLSGVVFPYDISLSDVLSVYAVLCIALNTSLTTAGSGGLCIGFLSAMSEPSAVVTMGIFGISALFANMLKSFKKAGAALGFIGGASIALLYAGNSFTLPVNITEALIGAALFVLTPKKVHNMIRSFFDYGSSEEAAADDMRVKDYLTMRLERVSDAFKSLDECFENASEKRLKAYNRDAAVLFDEAADRVCEGCPNAERCWQDDFTTTYRCIMQLLDIIETEGMLTMDNIPKRFDRQCIRAELFVLEFNHVYELYKKNLVRMGEAEESRDLVARQYREVAALMDDMAGSISAGFSFREDTAEEIINGLDKMGIGAYDVRVIEGGEGRIEVYMSVTKPSETGKIAALLEDILLVPMTFAGNAGPSAIKFVSQAKYSVDVGIRQISRDFSDVSGDSIASFMTDDYKHYIIIADGMGSGKRAKAESRMTLSLLREFLMSGFGIHTAIDMINSALCLKLDYESFSTVDLLRVDLMTGVCEFFKIGSAESVLMHGANVETVFSVSLPIGIVAGVKAEGQAKKLTDGDVIIMMSDGVSEAGYGTVRTDWIKKEIQKPFDLMDDMAQSVIDTAVKKSHDTVVDDMTVAAVRLLEN